MEDHAAAVRADITNDYQESVWKEIGNLPLNPGGTFRSVARLPRWFLPFLIVVLSSIVYQTVTGGVRMEDLKRSIQNNSSLTVEEIQRRVHNIDAQKATGFNSKQVLIGVIGLILLESVKLFGLSIVLWVLLRLLGTQTQWRMVLSICAFSSLIVVLQFVLRTPLVLLKHTALIETGPALILGPDQQGGFLYNFLANFDVFVIWKVVLLVLGLELAAGIARSRAAWCVLSLWGVWILLTTALGDLVKIV